MLRMKEKSVGVEGEKTGGVATDPPIATKSQIDHVVINTQTKQ